MTAAPTGPDAQVLRPWRPTHALVRAFVLGALGALGAITLRRADLLVLATPVLAAAGWGWWMRPRHTASATVRVEHPRLVEGAVTTCTLEVALPQGAEEVLAHLSGDPFVAVGEATAAQRSGCPTSPPVHLRRAAWSVRATRWGARRVGPVLVSVRSPWWAYRTDVARIDPVEVTAVPQRSGFDAGAPTPHPEGLVGVNRSTGVGSGAELASIRPFQAGDRLRRIHWPTSLRTGEFHVTTTHADQDAHVALVVDAFSDLGPREGVDGRATSLDLTVRAAASVAAHYLGSGDRVSLRVLGTHGTPRLPARSGPAQARRIEDVLAAVEPATDREMSRRQLMDGLTSGCVVVVLTPLVHPRMAGAVASIAARGLTTIAVDTLPEHLWADAADVHLALAWRLRRLVRDEDIHRLGGVGVSVVPWRGPGSLDQVLRDAARRARRPRMARR